ncbi:MAG: BamA/TamA family outer membrane protein [Planctomycetia bacterium]|nr:BamA/TamA family outer membrane protein [Planctomycetia bacterium]
MADVRSYISVLVRLGIAGIALSFGWCCDTVRAQPAFPAPPPSASSGPVFPGSSGAAPAVPEVIPSQVIPTPAPEAVENVVDVRVTGNVGIPLHKIAPHIQTRAGRPFNPDQIEEDVRRLTKTRQFVSVSPTYQRVPEGVVVVFQVLERPTLRHVKYVGASIRRSTLDKKTGIKVGDSIDPYLVDEARRKLEEYYQSKGYSKVRITTLEGNKPGDRGAVFLINEGPKQKVFDIEFEGNTIADDGRLKTQIQSKPPILYLFKGEVDAKKIDEDVDRLTAYYRGLGFFSAKIGREIEFGEDGKWATLRFVINEGPRYTVRSVALIGNRKFQTPELEAELKLKGGKFFDQASMTRDISTLQDRYGGIGYVFCNVQADPRFMEQPGELDLVYQIEEGDRYRVGRIDVRIEGDDPHTRINTVLNRIDLHPGDIVDIRRIRDSERRLKASGLFKNDPASGVSPKITFQAPDESSTLARGSSGGTVRGQSPDDARPPLVYSTPQHDGSGDRVLTVSFDAEAAPGAQPFLQRGPLPFVPVDPRPLPSESATESADDEEASPLESEELSRLENPFQVPSISPIFTLDDVNLFGSATVISADVLGVDPAALQATVAEEPRAMPNLPPVAPASHHDSMPSVMGHQPTNGFVANQVPAADGFDRSLVFDDGPIVVRAQSPIQDPPSQQPAYGQVPLRAMNPQTSNSNYAAAPQTGGGYPVVPVQYTAPAAAPNPQATPYAGQPGAYQPQPQPVVGVAPYGQQPVQPAVPGIPPANGYGSGNDLFGGTPTAPFVNEPLTRDLILTPTVEEAQTGRFMLGVGVNSNAGLLGSIVLDEQNADITRLPTSWRDLIEGRAFRGAGQQVRIEAVPGTQVSRYSAIFRQPYLFDTRISLSTSAYYFQRYYRDWQEERLGGRVALGYQFPFIPDLSVSSALRAEQVQLSNPTFPTPQKLQQSLGTSDLFVGEFAVTHDTRDSTFIATQGHRVMLGLDLGFGTNTFQRGTIEARQHFLLGERPDGSGRQVLTFLTQLGFTGSQTPIYESYFAGGFSSMRGFNFRGVGPMVNNVNIGGQFQWLNTVEYMFSMTADDMVRGVVFCDFGTVEEKIAMHSSNFRVAPGFGLRITVPAMGPAPIALDFAVPVAHAPGDNIQNFAFYVGLGR